MDLRESTTIKLIYQYNMDWLKGREMLAHAVFGLALNSFKGKI